MYFSGKHPKTRDTKWAHIFTTTVKYYKMSQYIIQRVNFVLDYSKMITFTNWLR